MPVPSAEPEAPSARRGPGRPRDGANDERIMGAALDLVHEGKPVTVSAIVEISGVSRASLYRRWDSLTDLVAAALDQGRMPLEIPIDGDIKQAIIDAYFPHALAGRQSDHLERRFRMRMQLVMADRELQRAYWRAHVTRRRAGMARALQAAVEGGVLRRDLDVDAMIDLINGVFYYQGIVRGLAMSDSEALARCRAAFETVWRGMQP